MPSSQKNPPFPNHNTPRVWLITSTTTPLGTAIARHVLEHGDYVVAGVEDVELLRCTSAGPEKEVKDGDKENEEQEEDVHRESDIAGEAPRRAEFTAFWKEVQTKEGWKDRCKGVEIDGRCEDPFLILRLHGLENANGSRGGNRVIAQCQSAIAEAVSAFGRLDILFCCASEALMGTIEELGQTSRTLTLIRNQFETSFFGPINIIKAAIPAMRSRNYGHIMILTAGHLGTPGLGMYCASGWALEGFCDSLAYEIAPFNIKMTIIQPTMEIGVLTNKIVSAPLLPQYAPESTPAPLFRGIIGPLLDRIQGSHTTGEKSSQSTDSITALYPKLPAEMKTALLAETINAVIAIGGHDNPPARHIVGHEGVASVKEKLKTVSEELEDFVEVSCAVDIDEEGGRTEDGDGSADE